MQLASRLSCACAVALAALAAVPHGARAQAYPSQDVNFICGFAAGSGADIIVRYFADKMRPLMNRTIIVQNKPGALGNIATEAARIVRLPDYKGRARDAAGYIRESILEPNAYLVPGPSYRQADGQSVMPKDLGKMLTPAQLDDLVAFLLTLR